MHLSLLLSSPITYLAFSNVQVRCKIEYTIKIHGAARLSIKINCGCKLVHTIFDAPNLFLMEKTTLNSNSTV